MRKRTLKLYTVHEGGGMYVVKAYNVGDAKADAGYSRTSTRVSVTLATDAEIKYYGRGWIVEANA